MDERLFSQYVREAEGKLFRIAYSMLRNEADCADAIQEALFKAWRKIDTLREENLFDTWLVRILINECHMLMRNRKRLPPLTPPTTPPDNTALYEAIMALAESERLPTTLYYAEGYCVAEIARMLRIPEGTVKSRLSRSRKLLREMLDGEVNAR